MPPPTRTPARVAAGRPPGGRKPPTDGRPAGGGGFFGRFRAAQQRSREGRGGNLGALLRDVRSELKKVEWPTREELTKLTVAIVGLSALVGTFLGGVDFMFQELFKWIIEVTGGVS